MPASTRCLCGYLILAPEERAGGTLTCARCGLEQDLPRQFDFPCPSCSRTVRTGENTVGMRLACPHCGRPVFVPESRPVRACPFCRVEIAAGKKGVPVRCGACGERLLPELPRTRLERFLTGKGRPAPAIRLVRTGLVDPNPYQPRERLNPDGLRRLTQSVARFGILVPLLVRPKGRRFLLVAGSRRLEAARRLGMPRVPVVARALSDRDACEIAYLENVQREDLDPMERAVGFQNIFLEEAGLPREELARRLGLPESEIDGMLRTLEMPLLLRRALASGRLTLRQARALSGAAKGLGEERLRGVAQAVIAAALTEEETEALARQLAADVNGDAAPSGPPA